MAIMRIRNAGQEREDEPMVSKRSFERVVGAQKHHYEVLRHDKVMMEEAFTHKITELEIKHFDELKRQKILIFGSSIVSFLVGGGLGWLIQ